MQPPGATSVQAYDAFLAEYYANFYKKSAINTRNQRSGEAIKHRLATLIAERAPRRALDIGCGHGDVVVFLAAAGLDALGVDLVSNPTWTEIPAPLARKARFQVGSFMTVAIEGTFDVIVDNGCFHHQHPSVHAAYLRRIRDHLEAESGVFFLSIFDDAVRFASIPDRVDHGPQRMVDGRFALLASGAAARGLLEDQGFLVINVEHVTTKEGKPFCWIVEATRSGA